MLDRHAAVIVCEHVAELGFPVLLAVRDEPVRAEDTGWQFLCGSGEDEHVERAQVWRVEEALEVAPTLASWLDAPAGTELTRKDRDDEWKRVV